MQLLLLLTISKAFTFSLFALATFIAKREYIEDWIRPGSSRPIRDSA